MAPSCRWRSRSSPSRPLPQAFSGSVYDLIARNADAGMRRYDDAPGPARRSHARADDAPPDADAPRRCREAAPAAAAPPQRPSRPQPTPIGLDTPSLIAAIGEPVAIETDDGRSRIGRLTAVDKTTLTIQQARQRRQGRPRFHARAHPQGDRESLRDFVPRFPIVQSCLGSISHH